MPGYEIFEGYDFIQVRPSCLNKVKKQGGSIAEIFKEYYFLFLGCDDKDRLVKQLSLEGQD